MAIKRPSLLANKNWPLHLRSGDETSDDKAVMATRWAKAFADANSLPFAFKERKPNK